MEYLDILNEEGEKIEQAASIKEAHEKGLWHRTVHVWFVNSKEEVLLQLRHQSSQVYPNCWDISAAGHISVGQTSVEAALRETEEEIGIKLKKEELIFLGTLIGQSHIKEGYFNNEFNDVYLVRKDLSLDKFKMQETEVQDLKWIPMEEYIKWTEEGRSDIVLHPRECKLLLENI